MANNKVTLVPF